LIGFRFPNATKQKQKFELRATAQAAQLAVRGSSRTSEVGVLLRTVARELGILAEGDPARLRAQNTILQEIRDD
jgi:hypothetical protein